MHRGFLGFRGFGLTFPSSPIGTVGPLARAGAACRPWDSHSCYKCGGFAGLSGQLGVHVPRVLLASCGCDMTSTCMIGRCRVVLSNMKCEATTTLMLLSLQERPANRYPQHPHRKNKGQKTLAEVVVVYIRVVLILQALEPSPNAVPGPERKFKKGCVG